MKETLKPSLDHARPILLVESAAWSGVGAGWRQLHGSFHKLGFSFEWHDFESETEIDWSKSFHPKSVELCLNLSGAGEVRLGSHSIQFTDLTAGFYRQGSAPLQAHRPARKRHRFITVEMSPLFLERHLSGIHKDLHPIVRDAASCATEDSALSAVYPMNSRQQELVASLRQPPVLASAQTVWFQAKALELMGEFFFQPASEDELFCHRQQRVARDRVDTVILVLRKKLSSPPTLEVLAREVGCSSFYLSRTFSKETGQTIPQYLRDLRLEKAAELLRSGRYNVTEAALEVGYNSLSHFSQAFHQKFQCCPGLYPMPIR